MIRPVVHSRIILRRPSDPAAPDDVDTLAAHADECVGMAANMIGVSKAVIVFHDEKRGKDVLMFNPRIVQKAGPYETAEGCLSLSGRRTATRYRRITVEFDDESFRHRTARYEGYTAQIIQHKVDHCAGVLI